MSDMASSAPLKLKRVRRGGRKKRQLLTEPCTVAEEVSAEFSSTKCMAGTAVEAKVFGKRKRKRYRKKTKKATDEAIPSAEAASPKKLNFETEGGVNLPQTMEKGKSTSECLTQSLPLKSSARRKRKRKRKQCLQVNAVRDEGLLVEATSIHQIIVGDIVTFDRMVLKDYQPFLETTTAKVFLKLKCGDSSSIDYDTLLIRPLLLGESEECPLGDPEFLKFAEVANVIRKVQS